MAQIMRYLLRSGKVQQKHESKIPEWRNYIKIQQPRTLHEAQDRRSQGIIARVLHLSEQNMNIENEALFQLVVEKGMG